MSVWDWLTGKHSAARGVAVRQRFAFLGGRRYLADAPYMLPKDDAEMNRLDFQHFMLRYVLHGNFAAPVSNPRAILDVGCGTGRWPIEMAQQFPAAQVIGLDLVSPSGESHGMPGSHPPNYQFRTGNILEGLDFPDGSFDFVHQRLLIGAIPAERWPGVVAELARVTRPGGWVELVEAAPVLGGGQALQTLTSWMISATASRGVDVYICEKIGQFLMRAGLQDVQFRELQLPMGTRGGRIGAMAETNYLALFTSLRNFILSRQLTTADHFDSSLESARAELHNGQYTSPYFVTWGRKV